MRRLLAFVAILATLAYPALADGVSAPSGNVLAITSEAESDDAVIQEIPRPATPAPPKPPAPPPAAPGNPPLSVQGQAGTLAFSVNFDNGSRIYHTAVTATGDRIRGSLSADGSDAFGTPLGIVTIGETTHHTSIGALNDPLSGVIVRNGSFDGVDFHEGTATNGFDAFSGRRLDGSNFAGVVRASGNTTDTLGALSNGGHFGDLVLRHSVMTPMPWGLVEQDLVASTHGTAVGIEARTRGATFLDATLSRATGTLPLQDGDLPSSLAIGRELGRATTLSLGYAESQGSPARGYVGVATRMHNLSFSVNASPGTQSAFVSSTTSAGFVQLFASTGTSTVEAIHGSYAVHRLQFEFDGAHSPGATAGTAQFRTSHAGLNLAAGADLSNGTLRPLVGVVAALTPLFALETAIVPGTSGHPALRLALVAGFRNRAPRVATFPLALTVAPYAGSAPLRLFVDGRPSNVAIRNGLAQLSLTAGTHDVYVATTDGALGSPQREVVAGTDRALAVVLIPQRTIHGRVRFAAAAGEIPVDASLQGIRVVLTSTGAVAACDADGVFVFPRAPYDAASTVIVDADTLPRGFTGPAPLAIPATDDDINIAITPQRAVERTTFK